MSEPGDIVLIFNSLHRVLRAEEILETAGAEFGVVQVPRRLSSDCGLAVRVAPASLETVAAALVAHDHLPEEVHRSEGRAWVATELPGTPA